LGRPKSLNRSWGIFADLHFNHLFALRRALSANSLRRFILKVLRPPLEAGLPEEMFKTEEGL
jgi:hypothetical protein